MFAGHFGVAAAVKAKTPEVPLWALMVSTQLLDIIFIPFLLLEVETIQPFGGGGYGNNIIHADYTHSLLGALLIAVIACFVSMKWWGKRGGYIIGLVVFSHWLLDVIVHHQDMPILPGNAFSLPLLGLGIWKFSSISILIESILVLLGIILYTRSLTAIKQPKGKWLRYSLSFLMAALLILSLLTDVLGIGE